MWGIVLKNHISGSKELRMQKTRVCIFCESWESGGIESFLNNILLHMDLDNLEIDLVSESIRESVFTAGLKEKSICFIELSG